MTDCSSTIGNITENIQCRLNSIDLAMDTMWLLWNAYLVIFMQTGFALLEAGLMRAKNTQSILFKNFTDAAIGCLAYYLVGFGLAQNGQAFVGNTPNRFAPNDPLMFGIWVFGWSFCITATTIVSGAVASRMTFHVYAILTVGMTGFIYPIASHWVWDNGWLGKDYTATGGVANPDGLGLLDFAGCAVVHIVGGSSALAGAWMVGPRKGRFELDKNGKAADWEGHSVVLSALGTLILWLGWYGFNPGSTGGVSKGLIFVASRAAVNTSIAACMAGMTTVLLAVFLDGRHNLWNFFNGVLAGLVAITAGCAYVEPWASFIIGFVAAFVVRYASRFIAWLQIDDAVDAFAVHGCCGMWGLISTGLLSTQANINAAHGTGVIDYTIGRQLGVQILGGVICGLWSASITLGELGIMKLMFGTLRVTPDEEEMGLDYHQFGSYAYPDFNQKVKSAQEQYEMEMQRAAAKQSKKTGESTKPEKERSSKHSKHREDSNSSATSPASPPKAGEGKEEKRDEPAPPSPRGQSPTIPEADDDEESAYAKQMRLEKEARLKKIVLARSSAIDVTTA